MSNTVIEAIKSRRSIRRYAAAVVSTDKIGALIDVARWAPSAHNAQPWRFILVSDPAVKKRLAQRMANAYARDLEKDGLLNARRGLIKASESLFSTSPVLIVACLTMKNMHRYPDEKRRKAEFVMGVQSVAASITTFMLAAHAQNFGTCWFCAPLFCQEQVREVLEIPQDVEPQAIVTLGVPQERPAPPARMDFSSIVFENRWGRSSPSNVA